MGEFLIQDCITAEDESMTYYNQEEHIDFTKEISK